MVVAVIETDLDARNYSELPNCHGKHIPVRQITPAICARKRYKLTDVGCRTTKLLSTFTTVAKDKDEESETFSFVVTQLSAHLTDPLQIDFASPGLFHQALEIANKHGTPEIIHAISKASLYASIVAPDSGSNTPDSTTPDPALDATASHILTSITSSFASALFQPPPALHMPCSDAVADHWMEHVVTPALASNGLADPFNTLSRISNLPWRDFGVCEECVVELRRQWSVEALTLWKEMDVWMQESGAK